MGEFSIRCKHGLHSMDFIRSLSLFGILLYDRFGGGGDFRSGVVHSSSVMRRRREKVIESLDHGHAEKALQSRSTPKEHDTITMFSLNWSTISCFLLLLTASFTSAFPAHQDDTTAKRAAADTSAAATVSNDLTRINNDVLALYTAISNFNGGGFFGALSQGPQIQSASGQLLSDIQAATKNAYASRLGVSEAFSVQSYVHNTLAPDISKTCQLLISKKSAFDSSGLTGQVRTSLAQLLQATQQYGYALEKTNPGVVAQGVQQSLPSLTGPVMQAQQAFAH
ncbi:hypothetical protein CERZMDRAFT_83415 [Cercospora zeae-maydis SCOH1-5]|uniref:Uncharacterized protein n=1 Tax=Cercospora zeae-maydis SCOH1-5 TaxID=717836 RepID=A0A6A6FKP0_9PEZI|nr:hypothetical protein CERZMDRAFT_83415 [Cercospora zeae-maydis SCOH1-5]